MAEVVVVKPNLLSKMVDRRRRKRLRKRKFSVILKMYLIRCIIDGFDDLDLNPKKISVPSNWLQWQQPKSLLRLK